MKNNTGVASPGQAESFSPHLTIRNCRCNSVWCQSCYRKVHAKDDVARLRRLDWRYVRTVTLTIDPKLYPDPQQAYLQISKVRAIPSLIHDLKRTHNILIRDWWCVQEWHRSGHAHWHLYLEVGRQGRAGQIGGDLLRRYWPYGAVREEWIRDQKHWDSLTGYFEKSGYLQKDKAHQSILPEWAKDYPKRIKKISSKRISCPWPKPDRRFNKEKQAVKDMLQEEANRAEIEKYSLIFPPEEIEEGAPEYDIEAYPLPKKHSYRLILAKCGGKTKYSLQNDDGTYETGYIKREFSKVIFELKNMGGQYISGYGYVIDVTEESYYLVRALIDGFKVKGFDSG